MARKQKENEISFIWEKGKARKLGTSFRSIEVYFMKTKNAPHC